MPRGSPEPPAKKKRKPKPAEVPPLRLEWRSPAELAENPANWRMHPEAQIAALTDVMAEVGWAGACLFNERTGRLIDGHARRTMALAQGSEKVPVLVGSWTEEQERLILATLDPIGAQAEADAGKLALLLAEIDTESAALSSLFADLAESSPAASPAGLATEEKDAGAEDEDALDLIFKAPFPWFGGKARVAKMVWKRFAGVQGLSSRSSAREPSS